MSTSEATANNHDESQRPEQARLVPPGSGQSARESAGGELQGDRAGRGVSAGSGQSARESAGGASIGTEQATRLAASRRHVANPDDPSVHRLPRGPKGVLAGPYYLGLPGRNAIVQGQVFIVAIILIAQLGMITVALFELLSGRSTTLGWLALISGLGFVLALIVISWPRRRIEGV